MAVTSEDPPCVAADEHTVPTGLTADNSEREVATALNVGVQHNILTVDELFDNRGRRLLPRPRSMILRPLSQCQRTTWAVTWSQGFRARPAGVVGGEAPAFARGPLDTSTAPNGP